jgi:exodeoxyribonuclease V gamma subunit
VGTLGGITAEGLILYRAAKLTVNDRIGGWVRHLALCAARPASVKGDTRVVAQDAMLAFGPVDDARERLRELLELYCAGLREPLHFFPKTSCEYTKSWEITDKVQNAWYGNEFGAGERDESPYYRLAFRSGNPLDADFERVTRLVLMPLYAALDKTGRA